MRLLARRWVIGYLVLLQILCCSAVADEVEARGTLITANFVDVSLREALQDVARLWGMKLYCGGLYGGNLSGSFADTPVEVALARILVTRPLARWRLDSMGSESVLVVVYDGDQNAATVETENLKDGKVMWEYLLNESSPREVAKFFKSEYPTVSFTPIPFESGSGLLRVVGSPEDLLQIKREMAHGGRPPDGRYLLPVRVANPAAVRDELERLVPEVQFKMYGSDYLLWADGPLESIEHARSLLWDLDIPPYIQESR